MWLITFALNIVAKLALLSQVDFPAVMIAQTQLYNIKFGHISARSLYPKLDEINAVVIKMILIFSVQAKHG